LVLLSALFLGLGLEGQAETVTNWVYPPNRYLIVLETSRTMAPRVEGIKRSLGELLSSAMRGQLHAGDTIGIWTFNTEVKRGSFPLEKWNPESASQTAVRVQSFIQDQNYAKAPDLSKVLRDLSPIAESSSHLLVLFVTSGESTLSGTPFDEPVNRAWKSWRSEQQRAKTPLVTAFRVRNGRLVDYTVNPGNWPVDLPPLPREQAEKQPMVQTRPPKKAAAPLIVVGKKTEPSVGLSNAAVTAAAVPAQANGNPSPLPPTNSTSQPAQPAVVRSPEPDLPSAAPEALRNRAEPAPERVAATPNNFAGESGHVFVSKPEPETPASISAQPKPAPKTEAPNASPAGIVVATEPSAKPKSPGENPGGKTSEIEVQTTSSATARNEHIPNPATSQAQTPASPNRPGLTPVSVDPAPSALPAVLPAQTAAVIPRTPPSMFVPVGAGAVAILACFVAYRYHRSSRPQKVSFITRSLDREKR
jgi:hypothetical protein